MTRARHPRWLVVSITLVTGAVALAGGAFAYWLTTGGGAGGGGAGTTVAVTLSPGIPTADLSAGGQSDVVLTVSNPNPSRVHFATLALDTTQGALGYAVDTGHSTCTVSSLTFTSQTNGGIGWTVPPKVGVVNGALDITLTNALSLASTAPNACQSATYTIYLAAS